jgi:hypothetical protein
MDWLQLAGLLSLGGVVGAIVALASAGARLKTDWETLRDSLVPYLTQRNAAGDIDAEFLLSAIGPVDADMKASAQALRSVQQRIRR